MTYAAGFPMGKGSEFPPFVCARVCVCVYQGLSMEMLLYWESMNWECYAMILIYDYFQAVYLDVPVCALASVHVYINWGQKLNTISETNRHDSPLTIFVLYH